MKSNSPGADSPKPRKQGTLTLRGRAFRQQKCSFDVLAEKLDPFLRQELRKRRPLPRGYTADDIVQITMLRIWKSFDQFRDDEQTSLSKWATTITARICAELGRKKAPVQMPVDDEGSAPQPTDRAQGPETLVITKDLAQRIEDCFSCMSEVEQQVFRLHILEDVPLKEIATRLGFPDATARSHMKRGKAKLAKAVEDLGLG